MNLGIAGRWALVCAASKGLGVGTTSDIMAFFKVVAASPSNYAALISCCCSQSGFSSTEPIGSQLRVCPDKRSGFSPALARTAHDAEPGSVDPAPGAASRTRSGSDYAGARGYISA